MADNPILCNHPVPSVPSPASAPSACSRSRRAGQEHLWAAQSPGHTSAPSAGSGVLGRV